MEEIAQQFREELQELIDRYKTRLSVPRIMHVAQDVLHKTLSIKYHPELHAKEIISIDISRLRCSSQMIAEADCDGDGDIKKCDRACFKGEWICTD